MNMFNVAIYLYRFITFCILFADNGIDCIIPTTLIHLLELPELIERDIMFHELENRYNLSYTRKLTDELKVD